MLASDERFIQALQSGARAWRQALERELKACGLTPAQWSAMQALAQPREKPPSQTELALQLGVDGATLVATIDRLASAGLLERTSSPHDRRVKLLVLTSAGVLLETRMRRQAGALRRKLVSRLDAVQVEAASRLLEQLQLLLEDA